MFVQGVIAAADMPAGQAEAQVHPARAQGQAFDAAGSARRHLVNHVQVLTAFRFHHG